MRPRGGLAGHNRVQGPAEGALVALVEVVVGVDTRDGLEDGEQERLSRQSFLAVRDVRHYTAVDPVGLAGAVSVLGADIPVLHVVPDRGPVGVEVNAHLPHAVPRTLVQKHVEGDVGASGLGGTLIKGVQGGSNPKHVGQEQDENRHQGGGPPQGIGGTEKHFAKKK